MHDTKKSLKTCAHEFVPKRFQKSQNQSDIRSTIKILIAWSVYFLPKDPDELGSCWFSLKFVNKSGAFGNNSE